jgi:CheY-like chemotaxis protein
VVGHTHTTTEPLLGIPFPRGWRFLVIDDFKDTAEMLCTLLRISGNECHAAHSGAEGLAMARFHRPEVILLDINMSPLDGYAVCKEIRSEFWSKHVKIIAFTGNITEIARITQHPGFDAFLVKPIDPEELAALLFRLGKGEPGIL